MTVGEIIRAERLKKRISCRALARESGLSLSTVFRIENDVTRHHKATLQLVANVLGLDVHDIVNKASNM